MGPAPAGLQQIQDLVQRLINLSVELAFVAITIMLVIGGFKMLTSAGDPKAVQSAQMTFTWALVGALFLIISWLILQLISKFTGVDLLHFCLGFNPYCL